MRATEQYKIVATLILFIATVAICRAFRLCILLAFMLGLLLVIIN